MKNNKSLLEFSLINIDKPSGPSSFGITEFVMRKLKLNKASHMGTLDPKVTGVLPITLGRACKLAAYFIKHDKTYVGVLHTHKEQEMSKLQELIDKNFIGKIKQTPPRKSAVKREERERKIFYFNFIEGSENKKDFLFECKVEGGTYIRKICSDLGELIGGAHMGELRRTAAGIFDESTLIRLDEFEKMADDHLNGKNNDQQKILQVQNGEKNVNQRNFLEKHLVDAREAIKKIMKGVSVKEGALFGLRHGKPLRGEDLTKKETFGVDEKFAVFHKDDLVGIYRAVKEKGIIARAEFVYD